jgi:hypothetical protein
MFGRAVLFSFTGIQELIKTGKSFFYRMIWFKMEGVEARFLSTSVIRHDLYKASPGNRILE